MPEELLPKKLPFSKQDYFRLLDAKLSSRTPSGNPLIERLLQASLSIKASTAKFN